MGYVVRKQSAKNAESAGSTKKKLGSGRPKTQCTQENVLPSKCQMCTTSGPYSATQCFKTCIGYSV